MKDPRLAKMIDMKAIPFDSKRMVYGGFKVMVDIQRLALLRSGCCSGCSPTSVILC